MSPLLTLLDLARQQPRFPADASDWKLIVHTSPAVDLVELVYADLGAFEYFQQDQWTPRVYNCRHIVSTVKLSSRTAMVVGAYDVGAPEPVDLAAVTPPPVLSDLYARWASERTEPAHRYRLTRNPVLDALACQVVIEVPTRGMKLNALDREVVALREPGHVGPCPDYDDLDVSLALLQAVFRHPEANPGWRERLSAVGGIYLLTDHLNHKLYVGKTDARQGFWDRWRAYAAGRTGNTLVDPAFASGALRPDQTTMSILQVVPRGSANERVIERLEARWMRRLQSRERGYNGARTRGERRP